jgi:hypothetical protein
MHFQKHISDQAGDSAAPIASPVNVIYPLKKKTP